jgi:hypothetical protein
MSDLLNKIMIIASANHLASKIVQFCPDWLFVIMEIDTEIAKKKEREGDGEIQPIPKKRPAWWVAVWYTHNDDSTHGNVWRHTQR